MWLAALVLSAAAGVPLRADTQDWSEPDLDSWFYTIRIAGTEGIRTQSPTWSGGLDMDESGQFVPHPASQPARQGMVLAAFDTTEIQPGLAPARYQVHALTLTLTMAYSSFGPVFYDDDEDSWEELLADANANALDAGRRSRCSARVSKHLRRLRAGNGDRPRSVRRDLSHSRRARPRLQRVSGDRRRGRCRPLRGRVQQRHRRVQRHAARRRDRPLRLRRPGRSAKST